MAGTSNGVVSHRADQMQAAGGQADGSGEGWCDLNCQVTTTFLFLHQNVCVFTEIFSRLTASLASTVASYPPGAERFLATSAFSWVTSRPSEHLAKWKFEI